MKAKDVIPGDVLKTRRGDEVLIVDKDEKDGKVALSGRDVNDRDTTHYRVVDADQEV